MNFNKYIHIERFGNIEVQGINEGECYIFPKLDGTNGSIWLNDDGFLCAGSRNRQLSLEKDNAGFLKYVLDNEEKYKSFFKEYPNNILYCEWLVPHSLKIYKQDAWRKAYVFDVLYHDASDGKEKYINFVNYSNLLDIYNIEYISPIAKCQNPTQETLIKLLDRNTYLIQDGKGVGEGIVIKNYDFVNKYGRTIWAKIITNEFKEQNKKVFGVPEVKSRVNIESKIIDETLTQEFILKEYFKIFNNNGWSSKRIPELLNKVYYEFVKDEMWIIIKKYKSPVVDFKKLHKACAAKIKVILPELF